MAPTATPPSISSSSKVEVEHLQMANDSYTEKAEVQAMHMEEPQDPEAKELERKLKWKLDLFILPLISSVYFFASIVIYPFYFIPSQGRSDLGNARIAGMEDELHLSAKDYSNAATTFLVGYILFQLPGTLLLKIIGPNWQFGGAMMTWGLFTALSVLIPNTATLLAMRLLIGCAEAFIQGAVFYLSFWYTYKELATRGAVVFSTSALAGAFNGLICYAISKDLNGHNGWLAWRWIFLIEGIMPITFSFVVFTLLPVSPEKLKFGFSKAESKLASQRSLRSHNNPDAKMEWKKILTPLLEIHFWLIAIMACAGHFCLSSLSNFLPAIIKSFGYSSVNSQLMSVIIYACAFVGILFWSRLADKTNARGLCLVASSFTGTVGYALLIGVTNNKARMAATGLVAFGLYPNVVLTLTWMAMSIAGYTKRGAATAFINIFSQLVAIAAQHAYKDPPYYKNGHTASLIMSALCGVTAILTSLYFKHMNSKKLRDQFSEKSNALRLLTVHEIGDRHPDFFYTT